MSQYAKVVPSILAYVEREREEDDGQHQQPEQIDTEPELVLHRYHVEGGGVILSSVPLDEEAPPPIVDSQEPETDKQHTPRKEPPFFVVVLLLFVLFLLLDNADTAVTALFTPTATITLIPKSQTITLHSSLPLGKLLAPITVSQSVTVPATGVKHQKATYATGTLVFYNGSSSPQSLQSGSVFTGSDGVKVTIDQGVTVPPANLPAIGSIAVFAHAVLVGSSGNIAAYDITLALSPDLKVRNEAPFRNGLDERDFQVVTENDITNAAQALKAKVTSSMTAALQSQRMPGQRIQPTPCSPAVTTDHQAGDEAASVTVRVSESCTAIAYDENTLQVQATQLLTAQAAKTIGKGYAMYGNPRITITKTTTSNTTVVLSFTSQATYLYQLTAKEKARIVQLIAGKPRATALRQLATLAGIQHVSISGIPDNEQLPDDSQHIHIVIFSFLPS